MRASVTNSEPMPGWSYQASVSLTNCGACSVFGTDCRIGHRPGNPQCLVPAGGAERGSADGFSDIDVLWIVPDNGIAMALDVAEEALATLEIAANRESRC